MKKKESLNLASYYAGSNDLRALGSASFRDKLTRVKSQRRKRKKRKANRNYLPDCVGEYMEKEKAPHLFAFVADIAPGCSRDTFHFSPDNGLFTIEEGKRIVRAKFLQWCKRRDIRGPFRFHFKRDGNTFRFLVESAPDLKVKVITSNRFNPF